MGGGMDLGVIDQAKSDNKTSPHVCISPAEGRNLCFHASPQASSAEFTALLAVLLRGDSFGFKPP